MIQRGLARRAQGNPGFFAMITELAGGHVAPVPGGVLIRAPGGALIGAVGISGDISDADEACAIAGIQAAGLIADAG